MARNFRGSFIKFHIIKVFKFFLKLTSENRSNLVNVIELVSDVGIKDGFLEYQSYSCSAPLRLS